MAGPLFGGVVDVVVGLAGGDPGAIGEPLACYTASMMPAAPNKRLFTHDEFVILPDDGRRRELIEGDFHVSPSPTDWHQYVVAEFLYELMRQLRDPGFARVLPAPFDVLLDDNNTVEPDLVVVRAERKHFITRRGFQGVPDLLVEVISPARPAADLVLKRAVYERFGVPEYWLVNPDERAVTVLALENERFVQSQALRVTGIATSRVFPMLSISLEKLFNQL